MEAYQKDAITEVIEGLVAVIGPDHVPAELDVDGALALLKHEEGLEVADASEEESPEPTVEA